MISLWAEINLFSFDFFFLFCSLLGHFALSTVWKRHRYNIYLLNVIRVFFVCCHTFNNNAENMFCARFLSTQLYSGQISGQSAKSFKTANFRCRNAGWGRVMCIRSTHSTRPCCAIEINFYHLKCPWYWSWKASVLVEFNGNLELKQKMPWRI